MSDLRSQHEEMITRLQSQHEERITSIHVEKNDRINTLEQQLQESKQKAHDSQKRSGEYKKTTQHKLIKTGELYRHHKSMIEMFFEDDATSGSRAAAISAFKEEFRELKSD